MKGESDMQNISKAMQSALQRTLADQYFYGEGSPQDLTEALRLYLLAAENGDRIAQDFLTICLENLELNQDNIEKLNTADWFSAYNYS